MGFHIEGNIATIVGESEPMLSAFKALDIAIEIDLNVLITGETGTGKELFSQAIIHNGPRSKKPVVAVNVSELSTDLFESQWFGQTAGCATNVHAKLGYFEKTHDGTLVLDHIDQLSPELQSKLLRPLGDMDYQKIGDKHSKKVTSRIIALAQDPTKIKDDLLYRLGTLYIQLPRLEERPSDIPLLVNHFYEKFTQEYNTRNGEGPDLINRIVDSGYHWPGNVRQLENHVRGYVLGLEEQTPAEENIGKSDVVAYDPSKETPDLSDKLLSDVLIETVLNKLKSSSYLPMFKQVKAEEKLLNLVLCAEAFRRTRGNRTDAANMIKTSYKCFLDKLNQAYLAGIIHKVGMAPKFEASEVYKSLIMAQPHLKSQ